MLSLTNLQFSLLLLIWFELAAFIVMDGADFGTGMATAFYRETEYKNSLVRSIGPVWSGRETWMVTAFAVMFAAFPGWYSVMFSGFYPIFILLLVSLAFRGVAFEYFDKWKSHNYNQFWRVIFVISNILPPFIFGELFALLNSGLPIGKDPQLYFDLGMLFQPLSLVTGVMFVLFSLQIGLIRSEKFIDGKYLHFIQRNIKRLNIINFLGFIVEAVLFINLGSGMKQHPVVTLLSLLVVLGALLWIVLNKRKTNRLSYTLSIIAISVFTIMFFWSMFPNVMMSTEGHNLTAVAAASARESQLWVAWLVALMFILITIIQMIVHYVVNKKYNVKDNQINY
ncbi:MAG TPA: cytochrome d ubiquinol oxidase subunit II [Lactobacillus sp.]|nr:cytochrome d ubiquinol oxidase subunit II [Lactobacillus sp.]